MRIHNEGGRQKLAVGEGAVDVHEASGGGRSVRIRRASSTTSGRRSETGPIRPA